MSNELLKISKRMLRMRIRDHAVIPFAGAGVSMAARWSGDRLSNGPDTPFPSWVTLLKNAAAELERDRESERSRKAAGLISAYMLPPIAPDDYLTAARIAKQGLDSNWPIFLKKCLDVPREYIDEDSLTLGRELWKLSHVMITTNYDRILSWSGTVQEEGQEIAPATINIEDAGTLIDIVNGRSENRVVWHLHGHVENPETIILDSEGYVGLYDTTQGGQSNFEAARAVFRILLATRSVLFVGFSLTDPYIFAQMTSIHRVFRGYSGPHFALLSNSEYEKKEKELDNAGILPILYSSHDKLAEFIAKIRTWEPEPGDENVRLQQILLLDGPENDILLQMAGEYLRPVQMADHEDTANKMYAYLLARRSALRKRFIMACASDDDSKKRVVAYIAARVQPDLFDSTAFVVSLRKEKEFITAQKETRPLWQCLLALTIAISSVKVGRNVEIENALNDLLDILKNRNDIDTGHHCRNRSEHLLGLVGMLEGKPHPQLVVEWARRNNAGNPYDMGEKNYERCLYDLGYVDGKKNELIYNRYGYLEYQ